MNNFFKISEIYSNNWFEFYTGFGAGGITYNKYGYDNHHPTLVFRPMVFIPIILLSLTGLNVYSLMSLLFFIYGYGEVYLTFPWKHERNIDNLKPTVLKLSEFGYCFTGEQGWKFQRLRLCYGYNYVSIKMPWIKKDCHD